MRSSYVSLHRFLIAFLVLFSATLLDAQQAEFSWGNRWRFGLNIGGTWQSNDLKKNKAGGAWGVTLEKGLTKSKTAILGFDLRYRFLAGNTYGEDVRVNRLLTDNKALNGTYDSLTNYATVPGYFFNNYKTSVINNDLELKIGLNRLLHTTRIHLYLWGGIGITKFRSMINALDANGMKYEFTGIDTTGGQANSSLSMLDDTYESKADGNEGKGITRFAPSFGAGIGYKFSNHFSLIFEHKLTFPGSDLMDGERFYQKSNRFSAKNDYYHYTACKLLFTFGGGGGTAGTYTNQNNYTTNVTPNVPPVVTIISPSSNPYTSPANNVQIYSNVKNVTAASGVNVVVNGVSISNFNFTPGSGALTFSTPLQNGTNTITITGTNPYGSDTETLTVEYGPRGNPPIVSISAPANNSSVSTSTVSVMSNVKNVSAMNQVQVSVNGSIINNFTFNSTTGDVMFTANLNGGNNSITISGTNQYGNDSESNN